MLKKNLNPLFYRFLLNVFHNLIKGYSAKSYSQEGEDMILKRIFENQKKGFYIDIGAHHPLRFSNTQFFYKRGWRGINIDCNPGSMVLFNKKRPFDINLEYALSEKAEVLKFNCFGEPALNSFITNPSENSDSKNVLIRTIKLKTFTLESVLQRNLPENAVIDFLTIDVEGMDLNVLKSNDWRTYRPKIVLVEDFSGRQDYGGSTGITEYMDLIGYILFAKTVNTFFFREKYFRSF